ncbi:MAG: EAL domain-containing protein [Cyanobacteriota bacterium]
MSTVLNARWPHWRLLAEEAGDLAFLGDPDFALQWASTSLGSCLGLRTQELLGRSIHELLLAEDQAPFRTELRRALDVGTASLRFRGRFRLTSAGSRWLELTAVPWRQADGALAGWLGSCRERHSPVAPQSHEVSGPGHDASELQDKTRLLETVLNQVDSHVYIKDAQHRYLYANRPVQRLLGRHLSEIVGHSDRELFAAEGLETLGSGDDEVFRTGRALQQEERVVNAQGEPRWFLSNKLLLQQNGECCLIGFSTDITARKQAEAELERSERMFRLLFEASLDPTMLMNAAGTFIDANPATLKLFGASSQEVFLRCHPSDFSPERQANGQLSAALIPARITRALDQGSHQFEWLHRRLDNGEPFLGLVTLKAITLNGQPALLSVVRDISESRRYEERLRLLAYHDELTGLPNRAATLEHLQQLLHLDASPPGAMVVVNLDFDGFQAVNDSFGLQAGNRVLIAAARVLRRWLQPGDWLARLNSDEFLVLRPMPRADASAAQQFCRELQQALSEGLAAHAELPVQPSASAGLSLYPHHGDEPIAMLQAANTALMEAKRTGPKAGIHLYSQALSQAIQERLELDVLLARAIDREQLRLLFQPQVDRDGALLGAEALLRWTLADGRAVSPEVFIPLAEQSGQMQPIGRWVMEAACAQLALWQRQGLRLPRLAINLSAVQFEQRDEGLAAWLMAAASGHGIAPTQLELEVTETALLRYPQQAVAPLEQLGLAGFRIAIDDFGTGYSSLVNLHALPVHKLKIDRTFVERINESSTDYAIIDSTLVIARKLGLETMAEGVETDAQWQALKALGCDSFQGYLFGEPMPPDDLAALMSRC